MANLSFERIDDAKFVSVERWPGRDNILRVHFTTGRDFSAFLHQHNRYIQVLIVPCRLLKERGYRDDIRSSRRVSDKFGEIGRDEAAEKARRAAGGSDGDYWFYMIDAIPASQRPDAAYNLRDKPEDMCASFNGRSGKVVPLIDDPMPYGYNSNTIVIPAEAIRAALAAPGKKD